MSIYQIKTLISLQKRIKVVILNIQPKNMSNNVFHFSVNIVKLEFQPIDVLRAPFFIIFVQKS